MPARTPRKRTTVPLQTGQIWYPADTRKNGRKIVFTNTNLPGPRMKNIIDRHIVIGFLTVDRNGQTLPDQQTFSENSINWSSWIMIEGFRAWIRKNGASMQMPEKSKNAA